MKTANPRYIELLNHQALVATAMKELEQTCTCVEKAAELGRSLGSDLYISDSRNVIANMPERWKQERRVKDILEMLSL